MLNYIRRRYAGTLPSPRTASPASPSFSPEPASPSLSTESASPSPPPEPPATGSFLILPDSTGNRDSELLRSNVQLSFKYASAAHGAHGREAPKILPVTLPDNLQERISEWLSDEHGTGAGLEVSAMLLRPVHTAETTNETVKSTESRLFSLPPEMRNRIYRFALLEKNDINISTRETVPPEPGLLRTCSQIRAEGSGIYYKENTFIFEVVRHDASVHIRWCRTSHHHMNANMLIQVRRSTNWPNLMVWLKAYHHRECCRIGMPNSRYTPWVMASLADIVEPYRGDYQGNDVVPWAKIEPLLVKVRTTLGTQDPRWYNDSSQ